MGSPLAPWEGASGRRAGRDEAKEGGSRVNICAVGGRKAAGRGWRVEVGESREARRRTGLDVVAGAVIVVPERVSISRNYEYSWVNIFDPVLSI